MVGSEHDSRRARMISIWTWVGVVLSTYGTLILAAGIYYLIVGQPQVTVLGELHPRIWWGGFMLLVGIVFLAVLGRKGRKLGPS